VNTRDFTDQTAGQCEVLRSPASQGTYVLILLFTNSKVMNSLYIDSLVNRLYAWCWCIWHKTLFWDVDI